MGGLENSGFCGRSLAPLLRCQSTPLSHPQQAPWGGIKNSGFGRELGEWGLDNYLSVKQVTTYVSPDVWDWYSPPSKL